MSGPGGTILSTPGWSRVVKYHPRKKPKTDLVGFSAFDEVQDQLILINVNGKLTGCTTRGERERTGWIFRFFRFLFTCSSRTVISPPWGRFQVHDHNLSYIRETFSWVKRMHESILAHIKRYSTTPLTENDLEVIREVFVPKKFRKRQYLLQEGEVCKFAAFIVKGALRKYSVDEKGVEHIISLYIENWWASDRESYVMLTPSAYNIDAWEETDVLLLTKANFVARLSSIPAINEMVRGMDDNFAIATQKRMASISLSAEDRYADLIKSYPEFLQRFPQHIIASYLGITKETLSRIRSHATKK